MGLFFTIPVLARNTKRSNQLVFLIACTFFVLLIVRSDLLYNFYSSSRIYVQSMSFFNLWTTFWFGTAVYWVVGLFFVLWNIIRIPPNFKDKSLVTTCIITLLSVHGLCGLLFICLRCILFLQLDQKFFGL